MMEALNLKITPEMQKYSDARTKMHIGYVEEFYQQLAAEFGLDNMPRMHDFSKLNDAEEKEPYVWVNWMYKNKREGTPLAIPADLQESIRAATLHHVVNNRHHPESYSEDPIVFDPKNRDRLEKMIKVREMPVEAVAEMVADWQAMSKELKTNTARQWFESVSGKRWVFHPNNVVQALDFIAALEE